MKFTVYHCIVYLIYVVLDVARRVASDTMF
jgi:hypothetical protein